MKDENPIPEPIQKPDEPEGYITKPVVGQRMKKCLRTIDNLMRRGLPYYRVGRSVIFRWSEIEAYLAANHRVSHRNGAH